MSNKHLKYYCQEQTDAEIAELAQRAAIAMEKAEKLTGTLAERDAAENEFKAGHHQKAYDAFNAVCEPSRSRCTMWHQ